MADEPVVDSDRANDLRLLALMEQAITPMHVVLNPDLPLDSDSTPTHPRFTGLEVVLSRAIPKDMMLIMPRGGFEFSPLIWEPYPDTVEGEAIKIVQDGMADIVAWLREAGHDIPTWEQVEQRRRGWGGWVFDEHFSMSTLNPRSVAKIVTP